MPLIHPSSRRARRALPPVVAAVLSVVLLATGPAAVAATRTATTARPTADSGAVEGLPHQAPGQGVPMPGAGSVGAARAAIAAEASAPAATHPIHPGYVMATSDGGVFTYGTGDLGQLRGTPLNRPVVGVANVPTGGGYWLVASDGGIFAFGNAGFYGSTGSFPLHRPIVGMAATADGRGYWLVASDGGIFAFGDAAFYGSTGSFHLNRPIVGMTPTADGKGYWLVASDGGIFSFGDAAFHGSTGGFHLNQPIVGMAATPSGAGYWLVASDGGIFSFGDAAFYGSTGGFALNQPIVGMAAAPAGGYWLVASDGGLFSFGAPYLGSTGGNPGPGPVVAIASTAYGSIYQPGAIGTDISFPQCHTSYPAPGGSVAIVGVNDGVSNTVNPCFATEAANAGLNLTVYLNTDADQPGTSQAQRGPKGLCSQTDLVCTGYNWGYNNAQTSIAYVHTQGYSPQMWWLDVEGPCGFSTVIWLCGPDGQASNAAVIQGALDAVHAAGLTAGIYSTYLQWPAITGGTPTAPAVTYPGLPIWIATVPSSQQAWAADCQSGAPGGALNFAGGTPWLIQWLGGQGAPTDPFDGDLACAV